MPHTPTHTQRPVPVRPSEPREREPIEPLEPSIVEQFPGELPPVTLPTREEFAEAVDPFRSERQLLDDLANRIFPQELPAISEIPVRPSEPREIPSVGFETILNFAIEEPENFINDLQIRGRTEDTELLLEMFGATPEDIDELLGPARPMPEWLTLDFWKEALFRPYAGKDLGTKAYATFIAGMGDVITTTGGAARWLGHEEAGSTLSDIGSLLQQKAAPPTTGEFEMTDLLDPNWWIEKPLRSVPFALSLAPMAIGGYYGGSGVAIALGLGKIWSYIIGGFAGAALSRPLESALEAGSSYDDAISRGLSEKEAKEEADEVFRNNMVLAGADAFEIAIALAPTPKWVPASLIKQGLVRTARVAGKMAIVGLSEGGEEVYQDMVQRHARGEEWKLDPVTKEVFAIGMAMGMGMGLGGDVITGIVDKSKAKMPPDMKKDFNISVAELIGEGFTPEQAELKALEQITAVPEGEALVQEALREQKAETEAVTPEIAPVTPEVVPIPSEPAVTAAIDALTKQRNTLLVQERRGKDVTDEIFQVDKEIAELRGEPPIEGRAEIAPVTPEVAPLTQALQAEYANLVDKAALVNPDAPAVIKATDILSKITPENQRELLIKIEALEDELKGIAEVPPAEPVIAQAPEVPDQVIPAVATPDVPHIKDIGILEKVRPTRKVFQKMGLGEEVWKPAFKAETELAEARAVFHKELTEKAKLIGKDKERRAMVFQELENPGTVKGLTFDEKRYITWWKEKADKWADDLGLAPEERVKNYITHIFEKDIARQLEAEGALDQATARMLEYTAPKTIFNPFLQKRLGATAGLIEDPVLAAEAYSSRQLKVFYYEPLLEKINLYAKNAPPAASRYLKEFSLRLTGKPLKIDQEVNNTLKEFGDALAKIPRFQPIAKYFQEGNPSGIAAYNFTSALYFLWLGFKPTSAIRNLSQHTLIMSETGPIAFSDGIRLRFTAEGKAALNDSLVLRSRKAAFIPGIDDSLAQNWTDKFRETALAMFRFADKQNVSDAFLAGYSEAKGLLPNADRQVWIDRGDEVAADTQYLYTKLNSFAMSQSSIGRVFSVLTTWSENWLELMVKWGKANPSQVYLNFEKQSDGTWTMPKKNWLTRRKSILTYMAIVGLAFFLKDRSRLKALEYTGLTSINYIADIMGGDFPALEYPGAVADIVAGILTDDERRMKQGLSALDPVNLMGLGRQIDAVASGDRDWATLFLYLQEKNWELKKLEESWEKGLKPYDELETDRQRTDWRKRNPVGEARLFVSGQFTTLSSDEARAEVLRIIENNNIDPSMIPGYDKVFGVDTNEELTTASKQIGDILVPERDLYSTSNFGSEVNKLEKTVGRDKIIADGNELAIAFLQAQDEWQGYENSGDEAKTLMRQQFPDLEANLFFWGHEITTFKNPNSADLVIKMLEKYGVEPGGIRAFYDDPSKYDEIFTPLFDLKRTWFDKLIEYEAADEDERAVLLEDTAFRDGKRRIEAYDKDVPTEVIDSYVEYYAIPSERNAQSKMYRINHPKLEEWGQENLEWKPLGKSSTEITEKSFSWAVTAQWPEFEDKYEAFDESERDFFWVEAERQYLEYKVQGTDYIKTHDLLHYAMDRRAREANDLGLPRYHVEHGGDYLGIWNPLSLSYVEYTLIPSKGYDNERFLMEHPKLVDAMVDLDHWQPKDFSNVPSGKFESSLTEYESLEIGTDRYRYRANNPEFDKEGVELGRWEPVDVSKVIPEGIVKLQERYDKLPVTGNHRLFFRHQNPTFEAYLVEKGYEPLGDRWMEPEDRPKPEPKPKLEPIPSPEVPETDDELQARLDELERKRKALLK
ncbi:hypothetical protein LCGC14_1081970 [marine sediment metagenome]|uniref:Large polyvalent protein associated domain-containing protein n=1 Tax=marine sediment metagenome TaxID=412755 RepID=A0A0F9QKV3_9ZZZZ